MPAYVPPHRRQDGPSTELHEGHRGDPTTNSTSVCQKDRTSSYSHRPRSAHGILLQAHGDSFVGPLTQLSSKLVYVCRYSGATAKGLNNEDSYNKVGARLLACLDETRPEKVLLQFGNVDINISSVYRLETKGEACWDEKQFVADVWNSYQTFLETQILDRLIKHTGAPSSPPQTGGPGYIKDLYLCKVTLPVVGDEALTESHAKYQHTERKKKGVQPSPENTKELELEKARCVEQVKPLIPLCGIEARRRMTAEFNARLTSFALGTRDGSSYEGSARLHLVDLNQYIRKEPSSDEVAAQYITDDPTNLHVTWENTLPFWIQELASAGLHTSHMPTQRELEEQWAMYADRKVAQMESMRQKRELLNDI